MPNTDNEILPALSDESASVIENIIVSALKVKLGDLKVNSGSPIKKVFIVPTLDGQMSNPGCWSHEIIINIPVNIIDHLVAQKSQL